MKLHVELVLLWRRSNPVLFVLRSNLFKCFMMIAGGCAEGFVRVNENAPCGKSKMNRHW